METKSKFNVILAYIYLAVPFAIFSLTFLRWYISIPIFSAFLFGIFMAVKEAPSVWCPARNKKTFILMLTALAIIFFAVYLSGIGKLVYQNRDHYWRNAIFDTLCKSSWPVYDVSSVGNSVALVYYIGFWLPSALVGKAFGVTAGYCFMALWTVLGIAIFYSLVCSYLKKFSIWPLVLFFMFSGLDILSCYFTGWNMAEITATSHIEWSVAKMQYSSFTTQLFWVFNQAVPTWIFTLLILLQKNNRNIVFLISLSLLSSTLPFMGMLPIVAFLVFTRKYEAATTKAKWWKCWFKDTFTLQNVLSGGAVGIISFLYLVSNQRSGSTGESLFTFVANDFGTFSTYLMNYIIFIIFEVLVYLIIIYPYHKKNGLYYVIAVSLLLIPIIKMGPSYDFCMRVSLPSLIVLYLFVTNTLELSLKEKKWAVLIPLLAVLIIGAITPLKEITRATVNTASGNIDAGTFDIMKDETQINFVTKTEDNFFFEYIAKK